MTKKIDLGGDDLKACRQKIKEGMEDMLAPYRKAQQKVADAKRLTSRDKLKAAIAPALEHLAGHMHEELGRRGRITSPILMEIITAGMEKAQRRINLDILSDDEALDGAFPKIIHSVREMAERIYADIKADAEKRAEVVREAARKEAEQPTVWASFVPALGLGGPRR